MSEIKLCKDCKNCMPIKIYSLDFLIEDVANSLCMISKNMVDGMPDMKCKEYRNNDSLCGKEAKYFEAK